MRTATPKVELSARVQDANARLDAHVRDIIDPAGVLDLFSKLAYEHPAWANAIVPKDLLELRVRTEAEDVPQGGYRIESSEFHQQHAMLEMALRHDATKGPSLVSRPLLSRRR